MILKRITYCFLIFFIILSSCTLQKRTYQKGYYVHWKISKVKKEKTTTENDLSTELVSLPTGNESIYASNDESFFIPIKPSLIDSIKKISCGDSLWSASGLVSLVKIMEISNSEIKYKRCSNIDGPTIVVSTSSVSKIRYANGTVDHFQKNKPKESDPLNKPSPKLKGKTSDYLARQALVSAIALTILMVLTAIFAYFSPIAIVFALLGIIALILTWTFSNTALRRIKREPDVYSGKTSAIIALIIAIVFTALIVLAIIFLFLLFFLLLFAI